MKSKKKGATGRPGDRKPASKCMPVQPPHAAEGKTDPKKGFKSGRDNSNITGFSMVGMWVKRLQTNRSSVRGEKMRTFKKEGEEESVVKPQYNM